MYRELVKGMCAELEEALLGIDEARLDGLVEALLGAKRIFVAGAGRTGLLMKSMAMTLAQCGLPVEAVGEVTTHAIGEGDLLVIGSASGSTKTMRLFAETARACGAGLALITTHERSAVADISGHVLVMHSRSDTDSTRLSVNLMGNGYLHQLNLLVDLVIAGIMEKTGVTEEQMLNLHANLE